MEWVRVKSEGNKAAGKARQIFSQRMQRCIRVGRLDTLVQVRNGENHFLDKLARDIGFAWRFCQAPEAETGGPIIKARCGVELAESMVKSHQSSCKGCRRVIDPNYTRKKRSDAKTVEEPTAPGQPQSDQYVQTVIKEITDLDGTVGSEVPLSLSELLKLMTEQRDHALDIAGQYDGVIAAAVNLDRAEKQIMEIEVQMASHRKALAEFISDDLP